MRERKPWNQEQDKILKHLIQERKQKKWSVIARVMELEFQIVGRNGKQCRQRYHNHLDSNIKVSEWTKQQQRILFNLHEQIGNKWSQISHKLPGRSDNCVKNHFYSKLRKSVRRLNKIIQDRFSKKYRQIKSTLLYKIIETTETKFKVSTMVDEEIAEFCVSIKNRLFNYQSSPELNVSEEDFQFQLKLIDDIFLLEKDYKKCMKGIGAEDNNFLKPPKTKLRKNNSSSSLGSEVSSEGSSFYEFSLSSSNFSDLSQQGEGQQVQKNVSGCSIKTKEKTKSCDNSHQSFDYSIDHGKIEDLVKEEKMDSEPEKKYFHFLNFEENEYLDEMKPYTPKVECHLQENLKSYFGLEECQQKFQHLFYEDTPFMARIISPEVKMSQSSDEIFTDHLKNKSMMEEEQEQLE